MTQFYVYIHIRPDGSPFYVGKGSGRRAWKFQGRSERHTRTVAKYGAENIIVWTMNCASESEAITQEITLIRSLREGNIDLANICDGGEGIAGMKHSDEARAKISAAGRLRTWTDERKAKFSASQIGNTYGAGHVVSEKNKKLVSDKFKGKPKSESHKAALSAVQIGKVISAETRARISIAKLGKLKSPETKDRMSAAQKARFAGIKK